MTFRPFLVLLVVAAFLSAVIVRNQMERRDAALAEIPTQTLLPEQDSRQPLAQEVSDTPVPARPANRQEGALSQAELNAGLQEKLLQLEDKFRAEPVSPEWAARSASEIRLALAPQSLENFNAPAPQALEISCRSTSCRISLDFEDPITAGDTLTALTVGIASKLPQAVIVPSKGEDGHVQYHVYATTGSGSSRARPDRGG